MEMKVVAETSRSKIRQTSPDSLIAALDVGSSKVCCLLAETFENGRIHVLGMGHRVSRGVAAGTIIDMEETEAAIRAAVDQAERVADERIDSVYLSLTNGRPTSEVIEEDVAIEGDAVSPDDLERVLMQAAGRVEPSDRRIIHAFPACYSIDGSAGIKEPLGMFGERLNVALHVITARPGPVLNLEACVHRAHLGVDQTVISGYAAGLGVLVEDERELGAAVIDIGGGTTSVGVFAKEALVFSDVFSMGGGLLTEDIARELLTPLDQAERLKTLYGSALSVASDNGQFIEVLQLGENENREDSYVRLPRTALSDIIRPRLEEIFMEVRQRLVRSGFDAVSGRRVVLTGGTSQLPGAPELAEKILGKQVRLGTPQGLTGLAEAARSPVFSVCAGLLQYAVNAPRELGEESSAPARPQLVAGGGLSKIGGWLRSNF